MSRNQLTFYLGVVSICGICFSVGPAVLLLDGLWHYLNTEPRYIDLVLSEDPRIGIVDYRPFYQDMVETLFTCQVDRVIVAPISDVEVDHDYVVQEMDKLIQWIQSYSGAPKPTSADQGKPPHILEMEHKISRFCEVVHRVGAGENARICVRLCGGTQDDLARVNDVIIMYAKVRIQYPIT